MKVTAEERPACEVQLTIELEPDDLEEYLSRAYLRVVRRAAIPGFRKGKAPRRVVEQFFGRGYLLNEALDFLVPEATTKAVQEQELDMMGQPKVELDGVDPVVIKATVPLRPKVDLGNYQDIRVKQVAVKVTKKQVNDVLKQLQYDLAPWEPVARPVQLGDLVNLDVNGRTDGNDIANGSGVDYIPTKDAQVPVPGFAEALEGTQPGETKEFTIDVPDDYGNVELAGKACTFTVSVNEVKEKRTAILDDEFAKGVGQGFESIDALTRKVKDDMVSNSKRSERQRHEESIIDQVVGGATMDLSPILVDHEIDHQIQEQDEALKQQRLSVEQYLSSVGKTSEELRDEIRPVAESRLKRSLVLQQVAEQEQIDVTDEDVEEEIDSLTSGSEERAGSVRDLFSSDRGRESLRRVILSRKTVQRLVDIATDKGKVAVQSSGAKRRKTA